MPADGKVGRLLTETLSRIPNLKLDGSKYEAMLNSAMQVKGCVCVCVCVELG